MSISSHRRKLLRLAEDDETEGEATLAELILGSEEMQEEGRNVETLVAFARELAGTRLERPAEPAAVVPSLFPGLVPPAGPSRLFPLNAWTPKPLPASAIDEEQRKAERLRGLRAKLFGYQLSTYEAQKLLDENPDLAESLRDPPLAIRKPRPNPWKLYAPSYATEETKATVRAWGGAVDGDPVPDEGDES